MASSVANVDDLAYAVMRKCCPGPFTFLLDRSRNLPKLMHDKRKTVGIRIPECELIRAVVDGLGKPVATASVPGCVEDLVTRGGKLLPQFGYQVSESFGHGIELILDLGEESPAAESTILSLLDGRIELVRQGLGDASSLGFGGQGDSP